MVLRVGPADHDGSGWVHSASGANVRTGANSGDTASNCKVRYQASSSHNLDYHCYAVGGDGYTWTYVHDDTNEDFGWIRDDLLSDGGSFALCP